MMSSQEEQNQSQWPPASVAAKQSPSPSATRPQLLPPFEPMSSSPSLPRPAKRKFDGSPTRQENESKHYPTPMPTSSTARPPTSSPLPSQPACTSTRPGLQRTASTVSERAPLATVPFVTLPANGDFVLMGRSSNSSHYQLSANRLISRVHVRAAYRPASTENDSPSVFVECLGWNGAKVHCRGQVFELGKGHTFSSDKSRSDVMLDVQDARVLVRWPSLHRTDSVSALSDATWEDEASPKRALTPAAEGFASSPPRGQPHLQSPVSPSPRGRLAPTASSTFLGLPPSSPTRPSVQIYEDNPPTDVVEPAPAEPLLVGAEADSKTEAPVSRVSQGSSLQTDPDEYSDQDEENDPIIHSFGVFGDNLLPRMESIHTASPERKRHPLKASISPKQGKSFEEGSEGSLSPVRNHVINQLAFSRLHSLPLNTLMKNLPAALKGEELGLSEETSTEPCPSKKRLTEERLKSLLDDTACIGQIAREGKDAAGKQLEDEFYYVPELDTDQGRKDAVENSLGKLGLRAVRKQHKQYFWKRPRH